MPFVSVITPVRNGGADIRELAECLANQTLDRDRFELVVGDDGSTDGGLDDVQVDGRHVRVVPGPPRNSYAARNRAVTASRGSVLAFCDADCRPEPEWLERGIERLADADLVAGKIRFSVPEDRTVWTLLDMDGSKDHELEVRVGVAETANLFLRRDLYDQVGGFDDSLPEHGDFDFVERCVATDAELVYDEDAVVWHPVRTRARDYLRAVWIYNRWYAAREARAGRLPEGIWPRSWVPLLESVRSRRRWQRSVGPDRRWLGENGVHPDPLETLRSLPLLYVLVPYLRSTAQLRGWMDGRSLRDGWNGRVASSPTTSR
jgi:glycosyltransferase involved in cell wall biosynthesis